MAILVDDPVDSFNPRARAGRDEGTFRFPDVPRMFQSTRPRGARPRRPVSLSVQTCFNPRARAGRDLDLGHRDEGEGVSIHAPARGATCTCTLRYGYHQVSIHAPARGATSGGRRFSRKGSRFNPRARAGRDLGGYGVAYHAGAFQSTRPRGARQKRLQYDTVGKVFQSTRPRGARPRSWSPR